ncbi:MAG: hypothetical protein LBL20_01030, partial [Treponema sp.]|nr:hypothetical protein [Treponema sp.]
PALSFCSAKTHESLPPASLPACLRQTPFLEREAWSFAMQNSEVICKANYPVSMPQAPGTLCGNFTAKSNKSKKYKK